MREETIVPGRTSLRFAAPRMYVVLLEGRCRFTVSKVLSEEPYFVVRHPESRWPRRAFGEIRLLPAQPLARVATARLSSVHERRWAHGRARDYSVVLLCRWPPGLTQAKVSQLDFTEAEADILANDVELSDLAEAFKASAKGLIHRCG